MRAETTNGSPLHHAGVEAPRDARGRWPRRALEEKGTKRDRAAMRPHDGESWRPAVVLGMSNEGISAEPAQGFSGQTRGVASRRPPEPAPNASIQGTLSALEYPLMNNFSNSNRIRDTRGHGRCSVCQMSLPLK